MREGICVAICEIAKGDDERSDDAAHVVPRRSIGRRESHPNRHA
jgi:hypothetical protein